jgi:hypothetical protein
VSSTSDSSSAARSASSYSDGDAAFVVARDDLLGRVIHLGDSRDLSEARADGARDGTARARASVAIAAGTDSVNRARSADAPREVAA